MGSILSGANELTKVFHNYGPNLVILSNNFTRCVTGKDYWKIPKFIFLRSTKLFMNTVSRYYFQMHWMKSFAFCYIWLKLEQLERLHSKDTPRHLMITHTIESSWIPSQKKTKSKLQIKKIHQNFKFFNFDKALHTTHLLKFLDKMCKFKMEPMSIVGDTERAWFCPQMDRRTRWYQYTPFQLRWSRGGGYKNLLKFVP